MKKFKLKKGERGIRTGWNFPYKHKVYNDCSCGWKTINPLYPLKQTKWTY